MLLFALSWWLRRDTPATPGTAAVICSGLGTVLGGVTGWLGGELVDRLGVGVDRGAHLNAPNSIRHEKIPNAETVEGFDRESREERHWRPSA